MKRIILLLSVVLLSWTLPLSTLATHISGGEITYEHLGNDSFLVTMNLYYDCSSSFTMQPTYDITIDDGPCTTASAFNLTLSLQNAGGTEVSQICPSQILQSTCNGGAISGMKRYTYQAIIQLSTHCTEYTFAFNQCCRNSSVNVFNQPSFYIDATLNSVLYPNNSSPTYTADPIPYVCNNQAVNYNYGVVENDGDSVSYAFVSARRNGGNTVNYVNPHSAAVPIPGITINSATGELNFTPTTTGNYIVAVEVTEYNGAGQVISTVQRDIQFVVLACGSPANKIPTAPDSIKNIVNTVGTVVQSGPLEITAQVGNQFCFDITFADSNLTDVMTMIDNATSALPGATSTIAGTNPITSTICWTVPPGMNTNNTVTFQVKDDACPITGSNSVAIQIIIPPPSNLRGDLTTTNITCNGSCDGTGKVVPSGGVGPYSYFWIPTGTWCCQGLDTISGLCPGGYILIVTDLGDSDPSTNKWDTSFTITDAPPMAILPPTIIDDDCSSTCVGQVSTFAFGGTAPRSFLWSNGATGTSIVGLCAATYGLTVTDAQGCQQSISAIVQEPTPPTILVDSVDSVTCFGGSDGVIYTRASPTCGVSTDDCLAPTFVAIGTGTSTNTFSTFPAPYGNSSNGARHQMIFTAAELAAAGVLPGTISSLGLDVAGIGTTLNYANFTISMGCTSASDLSGGWETGLTQVFTPQTHQITVGWNTHDFDVKYFWDGYTNVVVEICFNNPTATGSGNALTNYTTTTNQSVRYYHDNSNTVCGNTNSTATSANRPNVRFGNCESTFTYAWSPAPAAGQVTGTAINLSAQTYSLTVTSVGDGCTTDTTIAVDEPTVVTPVITLTNAISCPGICDASLTVNTTGGQGPYTYVWSNGSTATSLTNLCAGTFTVTVTDFKNCQVTESIVITEPTPIVPTTTINTVISCSGICDGEVTVSATGGTNPLTFAWPGGLTGGNQTNLCAGSYDVTITDAAGCFIVQNVVLTEPAVLTVSLTTVGTILCNGDNTIGINSTVTGGTLAYSYSWAPGGQTTPDLSNMGAGTYDLTVTDDHNCTATAQAVITEPTPLVVNISQTAFILCNGDLTASLTAAASGATPNYSYAWSNSVNTPINAGIGVGTYSLTVTDDNGCTDIQSFIVTEPDPVLANLTIDTQISCNGVCDGAVTVAPSGGLAPYTVVWQAGMTSAGNSATNLCGGVAYDVTITDANNCQVIEPIMLTEPPLLVATISITQAISCGGVCDGQLDVVATGGTAPYTYLWSNGITISSNPSLCTGTYGVTITDANNCTATASQLLTEPSPITVTINSTGTNLCAGDLNVDLVATAVGGTPGFTYAWSNSVNNASNPNLGGGTYTVTATDANGCTSTAVEVVAEPTPLVVSHSVDTPISCNAVCDGVVTVTANGGTPAYTITWPSGVVGGTQTGLCAGTYLVTIDDINGCQLTESVVLTEPAAIIMTSTINTPISCNGVCDGDVTVSTTGGTAPITITWPGGAVGGNQTNLCANSYIVTATDANGCSNTITVNLTEPTALSVSVAQVGTILCFGDNTVDINSTVVGGTINYSYAWGGGQTTPNLTGVGSGTYNLTITDANGCTANTSIVVTEPVVLDVVITQTAFISCGGAPTASLLATGSGGTVNYSFLWSTGATTPAISGLSAASYAVTITDANGCTDIDNFVVTQPTPIVANQNVISQISCFGVCDGSVTYLPTGGTPAYTYTWPAGVTVSNDTATGLCANTQYVVTITDANACTINDTILLTEPTTVSGTIAIDTPVSCNGVCDGQLTASGSGGTGVYTYAWPGGVNAATLTSVCAGTYIVTITDANGCTGTEQITITEPNSIVTSIAQVGAISCFGDSTVTLTASSIGGTPNYSYLWNTGATTAVIANTGAGIYTVTATDASGCMKDTTITISQPTQLVASITQTGFISCGGAPTASLLAAGAGGTPNYTYLWSTTAITPAVIGLAAGSYTVTIADLNGCKDSTTFIVTQPTPIVANQMITNPISCFGVCDGSVTYAPTGGNPGYTYTWPAGVTVSNDTAIGLCANTQYVVTITDANTCTINDTILLTEPTTVSGTIAIDSPISCGGICDGQLTASGSGGTGAYTYAWPGGVNGATLTSVCAGTYIVTITDANGCTGTESIIVTEPTPVLTTITQTGTILCFGDSTVTLTAASTGGTPTYSYVWNTGSTSPTLNNTGAGAYTVTTTDANGCSITSAFTVSGPTAIVLSSNITTQISCAGQCDAAATIIASGGTPGMSFTWPSGATGASQSNLCAGDYIVTVTDASGCSDTTTVSVVDPLGIVIITNVTSHISCPNICDGEANITVTGGTAPIVIAWPSGGTGLTESNLCAGIHAVTVSDASGCSRTVSVVVNDVTPLDLNLVETGSISCNGDCNGIVSSSVTGGTAPYTVIWPGNDTTDVKSNLCSGTYSVTVVDANGCDTTQNITLTEPALLTVTATATTAISCNGVCDGVLTAVVSGGTTPFNVNWSDGSTGLTLNNACVGTYTFTVTDANGCTASGSVSITEPAVITSNITTTNTFCGICTGVMRAQGTAGGDGGPYTYVWSGGNVLPAFPNRAFALCAGVYSVTITDGSGCSEVYTETISSLGGPTSATFVNTDPTCHNGTDGSMTVTAGGGTSPYTYAWSTGGTNSTETGMAAGIHFVTITDANNCERVATDTLVNPDEILSNYVAVNPSCNGACDGSITVAPTGGTAPYTITHNVSQISSVCAGTFIVTTTDANNCFVIDTIVITDPTLITPSISITQAITCNGSCDGEITASASGGTGPYSMVWSNGGIGTSAIGLCAGTHSVTITDANGCTADTSLVISEPDIISATLSATDATCGACDGGIVLTNPIGGDGGPYTYAWSNGSTALTLTNLCAGLYQVTITDGSGCSRIISTPINNVGGPTAAPITLTNPSCSGVCDGTMQVVPAGGTSPYTFTWSTGGTTDTENSLCAGIYFVTVFDANGCVFIGTDTIVDPDPIINMDVITDATCNGVCDGTITLTTSGGSSPYTYLWSTGAIINGITAQCAGTYTVVTTDANGCSVNGSYVIDEPAALNVLASILTPISCNGVCDGEISAGATGGTLPYSFLWSTGATSSSINNLCDGTYTVTITDANGCTKDTSVVLSEPAIITATITPTNATCGVCDGQVALTNVAGGDGGPYTFAWSNSGTGATIMNLCPASYDVTITDGSGCTVVLSSPVSNNGGPTGATFVTVDPTCSGLCDGSSTVTPIGGSAPFTFLWASGTAQNMDTSLCAGAHEVTITDASGCILIISDTLVDPTPIVNVETIDSLSCKAVCDGTITLVTSGGTAPYTYIWDDGTTGSSRSALCAGTYLVTTTDASGCITTNSYVVSEPTLIIVSATGTDATCFNVCDGSATVSASGGTGPYTYAWSNGDAGVLASNLCTGTTYDVTVTDSKGCTETGTVTISSPPALVIDNILITNPACGASDGALEAVVSGGTAPYTYLWNSTTPGNPLASIPAASYTLEVTDANGCSVTQVIPLSDVGNLTVLFTTVDVPCNGACLGEATATAAGAAGPFNYSWSTGAATQTITGLCAGQYIVTATDVAGGCIAVDTISISQQPGLILTMDSTNNTNCGGVCDGTADAIVSGATAPITYNWSNGGNTPTFIGLCAGTYFVTVTDAAGCDAIDSVIIVDGISLSMVIDTVINANCASSNDGGVQITTTGGVSPYLYQWTGPAGFTSANQNIGFLLPGTYFVTVTDQNGCAIMDTTVVGINTDIQVTVANQVICSEQDSVTLTSVVTGDDGTIVYQWYNLGGAVVGNDSNLTTAMPNDTTYYIVEVISGGCSGSDTAYIAPGQIPDVDAGISQAIVKGQSVAIGGSPTTSWGGSTYLWRPSETLSDSTVSNPIASPQQTTVYSVTVTNILGCSGSDTVTITVTKKLEVVSGFTPNGDGDNDYWELDFIEKYPSATVEVYNRWGELMYQSEDGYPDPWDGTFEGNPVPVATYYYVIDLKDGDFPDPISGPVTIVR